MGTDIELFGQFNALRAKSQRTKSEPGGSTLPPIARWPGQSIRMDFMGTTTQVQGPTTIYYLWLTISHHRYIEYLRIRCVTSNESQWPSLSSSPLPWSPPPNSNHVRSRHENSQLSFPEELHRLFGTKLLMSTAFHPQMTSAIECTIIP